MRGALAIGFLALAMFLLAGLNLRTESGSGSSRLIRIGLGVLAGFIAAAVTISIGFDVVPDAAEGDVVDLLTIILAAFAILVLAARRLR